MTDESLRASLAGLRSELARAHDLDEGVRQSLEELAREVEAILAAPAPAPDRGLRGRFGDWLQQLEASHPRVSNAVARVVDTLAFYGL
jgi:hypothetical protein